MTNMEIAICTARFMVALFIGYPCSAFLDDTPNKRPLLVGSWNIQHFGRAKMADATRANRIAAVVQRYDIVAILETRDSTGTALQHLLAKLNSTEPWGMEASDPIGRSKYYKEQYVFFYKKTKARLLGTYQSPDPSDIYEREPYSASFQYMSVTAGKEKQVALMALHAKPDDVPNELTELPHTIRECASHFPTTGGVVTMGDFNADCHYVDDATRGSLVVLNDKSGFTSLLNDTADTTTSGHTDCAYDRIVTYGNDVMPGHARVYNYTAELQLTESEALDISDHYPVEFELQ